MDDSSPVQADAIQRPERRIGGRRASDHATALSRAACLASALEHLPHRTLLLIPGVPLRVWYANAAARLPLGVPLLELRDDRVELDDASARQALHAAVRRVTSDGPGHPVSLTLRGGEALQHAVDVRLDALDVAPEAVAPVWRLVLMQLDEAPSREVALQRLCADYGLTQAEAAAALLLHARGSTDALARTSGKSVHTVRSQIKAAMQKTETHSQAALVALVGRCLARV